MADRSAAALFADIFEFLAKEPEKNKETALRFWEKQHDFAFRPYQMGCDDALRKLGLLRTAVDPRRPHDGEVDLYGPDGDE